MSAAARLPLGQGVATQNGHPAQQFRAMLRSQVRISRQDQAKDVYLRVIDRGLGVRAPLDISDVAPRVTND